MHQVVDFITEAESEKQAKRQAEELASDLIDEYEMYDFYRTENASKHFNAETKNSVYEMQNVIARQYAYTKRDILTIGDYTHCNYLFLKSIDNPVSTDDTFERALNIAENRDSYCVPIDFHL